jgi:hypothetical protein
MATGLVSSISSIDEPVSPSVRRSRLSFHLTTRRVRRWLLVQLVSMPVEPEQEREARHVSAVRPQQEKDGGFNRLLNEYQVHQMLRHTI